MAKAHFFACQNNIFSSRNPEVLNVKASLAAANNFWREKFLFVIFFFWKWFVFMPPRRVEERNPIDNYQIRIGKCVHLISSDSITKCRKFLMAIMGTVGGGGSENRYLNSGVTFNSLRPVTLFPGTQSYMPSKYSMRFRWGLLQGLLQGPSLPKRCQDWGSALFSFLIGVEPSCRIG